MKKKLEAKRLERIQAMMKVTTDKMAQRGEPWRGGTGLNSGPGAEQNHLMGKGPPQGIPTCFGLLVLGKAIPLLLPLNQRMSSLGKADATTV